MTDRSLGGRFRRRFLTLEVAAFLVSVGLLLWQMRRLLFVGDMTVDHDAVYWAYAVFTYWADGVLHGHLPLWNPYSHGGEPLLISYLQLKLLDPLNYLTVWIGGLFTKDLTILFNWWWMERCLVAALGTQMLLRGWAKNPMTRASLAPIAVLASPMMTSFHQIGVLDQFYCTPFMLFFMFRLLSGRYDWRNWMGVTFFLGCSLQSYFFTGAVTAVLTVLIGFLLFRRWPLRALLGARANWVKAVCCLVLLAAMALPNVEAYRQQGDYHFTLRNVPLNWPQLPPQPGVINYDLAPDQSVTVLDMPYGLVRLTGAPSNPVDAVSLLAPPRYLFGYISEAYVFFGGLAFLVALIGLARNRHPLRRVWLFILATFGLLMLGPNSPVHGLLFSFYFPLWYLRNTEQLAPFFVLALQFFFVLGADRLLAFRRPLFACAREGRWLAVPRRYPRLSLLCVDAASLFGAIFLAFVMSRHIDGVTAHLVSWPLFSAALLAHKALSLVVIVVPLILIAAREGATAVRILPSQRMAVYWCGSAIIIGGILVMIGIPMLYWWVPVGQLRSDWFVTSIALIAVMRELGSFSIAPLLAGLMAAGLALATMRVGYLGWIGLFVLVPLIALLWLRRNGGKAARVAAGGLLVAVSVAELMIAAPMNHFTSVMPDITFDTGTLREAAALDWPVTAGAAAFPATREAAIAAPPHPGEVERYAELLIRRGVVFDTPRIYPDKTFVNDIAHVLNERRWNSFALMNPYNSLIQSGLDPAVLGSIFAVDAPVLQLRVRAVATDDFAATMKTMSPGDAVTALKDTVFLDRETLPAAWQEAPLAVDDGAAGMEKTKLDFDTVTTTVITPQPAYLSVADSFSPDWQATVHGKPAPVLRANGNFKAVAVPAGESEVTLAYRPSRTIWSLRLFYGAFVIAAFVGLFAVPRRITRA